MTEHEHRDRQEASSEHEQPSRLERFRRVVALTYAAFHYSDDLYHVIEQVSQIYQAITTHQ